MTSTIIFFDLETGGLEMHHPITQLAAVAYQDGAIIDQFEAKLRFDPAAANPEALKLNGYSESAWAAAQDPGLVARQFAKWLEPHKSVFKLSSKTGKQYKVAQLGGYNAAAFDGPRIQKLFKDNGVFLPADYRILDVMQLVMWYFQAFNSQIPENLKLATVCQFFGIRLDNAHDALSDVLATAMLMKAVGTSVFEKIGGIYVNMQKEIEEKMVHGLSPTRIQ